MASFRGILNIQSLNELTPRNKLAGQGRVCLGIHHGIHPVSLHRISSSPPPFFFFKAGFRRANLNITHCTRYVL